MNTIIATVGTSLLTNQDKDLSDDKKRPWVSNKEIGDQTIALKWMSDADPDICSAEINTLFRLDINDKYNVYLLHSDTADGEECAVLIRDYINSIFKTNQVELIKLPGINYDMDIEGNSLTQMIYIIEDIIKANANNNITMALTGGFKAQVAMMAVIGNSYGFDVCYVHEKYETLVYIPKYTSISKINVEEKRIDIPESGREPDDKIDISSIPHHRPKSWTKLEKKLKITPWVDRVYYNSQYNAPKNGVKQCKSTKDGRHVYCIFLRENDDKQFKIAVETTGYTDAHAEEAALALRKMVSDSCS